MLIVFLEAIDLITRSSKAIKHSLACFNKQASPEHLLSAAIMSAPAALAMAKLSYPETEVSVTRTEEDVYIPPWYV